MTENLRISLETYCAGCNRGDYKLEAYEYELGNLKLQRDYELVCKHANACAMWSKRVPKEAAE